MKTHVLFVCLGNICRSPIAEAVFRSCAAAENLENAVKIESCGLGDWHIGRPPHEKTLEVLNEHQINTSELKASLFDKTKVSKDTYIIVMDDENEQTVRSLISPDSVKAVHKLLDFHPEIQTGTDVPDPYFSGDFSGVYDMIEQSCKPLLNWVRKREGL
ncbi:protein tyrosine phosphatase [Sinobaca qinghaiensis]|uniref:protein-tyrosine-phosphatase n=2 Tax=Sinobaca TaxID=342943 RepID=A0A419V335_9BACL|nr:low molecular weight protein-tyrosine-phosphatase [Sinobaca qinghaiensis]RKD72933.1 protein tyrosine phosphatase [Sinobaca qinghaiensis]